MQKSTQAQSLSYLVTVSRAHLLPAQMLLLTLRKKTKAEIVVVGNLEPAQIKHIEKLGAKYIDEDAIDYKGRLPQVNWQEKYRKFGWYKQMFIRLCIDTFMTTDQVVILDSEVFVFDNWDESYFYDSATGQPRCFYWVPKKRKSDWDYRMYRGAAYLLSFLPECQGVMEYANSDTFRRHISGVVLFSTKNVAKLWQILESKTDLHKNMDNLFNNEPELAFCDHDIYGIAVDYSLFVETVPTKLYKGLLGWYDNHDDVRFQAFKKDAMWSMCQNYAAYGTPEEYYTFMRNTATELGRTLPMQDYQDYTDVKVHQPIDDKEQQSNQTKGNMVKRAIKHTAKKVAPGIVGEVQRLHTIDDRLVRVEQLAAEIHQQINVHDLRLDRLKTLAAQVEPYQPSYGVSGIFATDTKRDSKDRCRVIEQYFGGLSGIRGKRILDIGSSIGYVDYYFADRGALCEGWEMTPANAEVARLVGEINGIPVTFKTKEFNSETVRTIATYDFDIAIVLSVFHHIIRFNGLEYTQKLVKDLLERVPIVVVELAKKGEDPKLVWNKSQPQDELAIFDLVKDEVDVKKLGEFGTHLSSATRPLYVISKKKLVTVNNHTYAYDTLSIEAYKDSPAAGKVKRRYYFSPEYIVKHYSFSELTRQGREQNTAQILNEIQLYLNVVNQRTIHNAPEMMDFEVSQEGAYIVLTRAPGALLSDLPAIKTSAAFKVASDVLTTLADLEKVGLYHNDVRSWNVLFDKRATLIDYGLASSVAIDNDAISSLWMLHAAMSGTRESSKQHKTELPPKKAFSEAGLAAIYSAVAEGEYSPTELLELLKRVNRN